MKTLILTLIAASALAAPCEGIDWNKYYEALKGATRTNDAIKLREDNLPNACTLIDYYRLTQMENSDASEIVSQEYIQKLRDFTVNNFDMVLAEVRFSQVPNETFVGFLAREKSMAYRHEIRRAFYTTVRTCQDVERVTRPIASDDRWERRQLNRDLYRLEWRYCR